MAKKSSKPPVAFVTGITGQTGSHLADYLLFKGYKVVGLRRRTATFNTANVEHLYTHKRFETEWGNLTDSYSLYKLLQKYQPDLIFNLGAQSHVRVSFDVPEETLDVVAGGTLKLLNAYKEVCPEARFYQAGSSEMFGDYPNAPQREDTPFQPASPYACFPSETSIVVQREVNGKNNKKRLTTGIKNISEIKKGDLVLSYNKKTSEKEWKPVVDIGNRKTNSLYHIKFSNNNFFKCTKEHPVFVISKGWVNASDLKIGDKVIQYRYPELRSHCTKGKTRQEIYGEQKSVEISKKASFSMKKAWKENEKLDKEQYAKRMSKNVSNAWKNDNSGYNSTSYRKQLEKQLDKTRSLSHNFTPTRLEKMSEISKHLWKNSDFVKKQIEARHTLPNNLEKEFIELLEKKLPGEYSYNGKCDLGILVDGKVPDFVCTTGRKKVIEIFGNYWHTLPGKMLENETKQHYENNGYECLIIWESDYKNNRKKIEDLIEQFHYNPGIDLVTIESIENEVLQKPIDVYNFEVEDNNNYFARGILVHNCAKVYAHNICRNYRESYGLYISCGILFNHEGPRRGETFVTRKITQAAARIKLGLQDKLYLGNVDAKRDWGYAVDYAEGIFLMLQQDKPDDYVLATGETHSVKEFLDETFKIAGLNPAEYVKTDKRLFRPHEVPLLLGDASKAKRIFGWEPKVKFRELIKIMYKADLKNQAQLHNIKLKWK